MQKDGTELSEGEVEGGVEGGDAHGDDGQWHVNRVGERALNETGRKAHKIARDGSSPGGVCAVGGRW